MQTANFETIKRHPTESNTRVSAPGYSKRIQSTLHKTIELRHIEMNHCPRVGFRQVNKDL